MRNLLTGAVLLWCAIGGASAQNYPAGEHALESDLGEVRINSGFVSHLNAHAFYVYTFLFRPTGEKTWHQLPIVRDPADPELKFIVTRTATGDFTTRDAKVVADASGVTLSVAQLRFDSTPYDDDASVQLEIFRLRHLEEEGRWLFERERESRAAAGRTVEDALRDSVRGTDGAEGDPS